MGFKPDIRDLASFHDDYGLEGDDEEADEDDEDDEDDDDEIDEGDGDANDRT